MADGVSMDTSELRALAADLTSAGAEIDGKVLPVVKMGAGKIKAQMMADMRASRHFKGAARSISYDVHGGQMFGVGVIEAEIGPVTGPGGVPGDLAHIAYWGTSRGGGTVPDPQTALDTEAPRFEKALLDILGGML